MTGLTHRDAAVLEHYAMTGNRERYWNYLAHLPGNDGYGLMALGVVRNDSVPGAVANSFARAYAEHHDGVQLDERGWEDFGRNLVRQDFKLREAAFLDGQGDLALNLPARDVQDAHALAFEAIGVGPDAWTPNILLDAAEKAGGKDEVEKAWQVMLDGRNMGLSRMTDTSRAILFEYSELVPDRMRYMQDLAKAEVSALSSEPATDPDHIRHGTAHYDYDPHSKSWTSYVDTDVAEFGFRTPSERVTDSAILNDLEVSRAVRLERKAMAEQVHPDDPYQEITKSPHTIASARPESPSAAPLASSGRSIDPDLYDDLKSRLPEGISPERLAQVTLAARQADMRATDVLGVSLLEDRTLFVHGRDPGDRAAIDLSVAPPSLEQTLSNHQAHEAQQAQQWTQFQTQSQQIEFQAQQQAQMQSLHSQAQSGPTRSGPGMS
jgi:hypothetical protein